MGHSDFTCMSNSCLKVIFNISRNHVSLQFSVVNSSSCPIHVISAVSHEIALILASFSLKIKTNGENYHSCISYFTQMVRSKITFTFDSLVSTQLSQFSKTEGRKPKMILYFQRRVLDFISPNYVIWNEQLESQAMLLASTPHLYVFLICSKY